MDFADIGKGHTEFMNSMAIREVMEHNERSARRESATECEECGDDIPKARRDAVPGCVLCVHCQSMMERGF